MTGTTNLTALVTAAGKAHSASSRDRRGAQRETRPGASLSAAVLAQLRDAVKTYRRDFDQLSEIVNLATGKPTRSVPETLRRLQQLDQAMQQKPAAVHHSSW